MRWADLNPHLGMNGIEVVKARSGRSSFHDFYDSYDSTAMGTLRRKERRGSCVRLAADGGVREEKAFVTFVTFVATIRTRLRASAPQRARDTWRHESESSRQLAIDDVRRSADQ